MNLQSCCHKCRVKQFHYRGKENETMLPFYGKHCACMRENPRNVETLEGQIQEADWMCGRNGYPDEDAAYQNNGQPPTDMTPHLRRRP